MEEETGRNLMLHGSLHSSLRVPLLPVYPRLTVSACFRLSLIASNRLRRVW